MIISVFRTMIAYIVAVIVAFVVGSALHTFQILNGLRGLGAEISVETQIASTISDIAGFATRSALGLTYPIIIAIGLAVAFVIAFGLKRIIRPLAPAAYIVAAGAAIGVILALMFSQFQINPIAGSRGTVGLILQILAGAVGGLAFTLLRPTSTE